MDLVLDACSGVVNLALFMAAHPSMVPRLATMNLRQFYVDLQQLFGDLQEIDFTLPLFASITHLDLLDILDHDSALEERLSDPAGLPFVPGLTHLRLHNTLRSPVFCSLLLRCKKLQILASAVYTRSMKVSFGDLVVDDACLVLMKFRNDAAGDWPAGTRGERDFWTRAEMFAAMRRRGEIQSVYDVPREEESSNSREGFSVLFSICLPKNFSAAGTHGELHSIRD
ncbi:hypothetical protein B0H17DRAFT_1180741 [Mycena rosella]|uniref:F-box domain-containing protein n=1 Tax=Mycena rosella TaxID=1033263 RepID=A0AAD7DBF1_MYCRO|nr:hypothetical protein B0H17DRAFT_1180741 [Mycena rosella]